LTAVKILKSFHAGLQWYKKMEDRYIE